jgi:hypothetical protein
LATGANLKPIQLRVLLHYNNGINGFNYTQG